MELIQQYKSIDEILTHKSKLPSVSIAGPAAAILQHNTQSSPFHSPHTILTLTLSAMVCATQNVQFPDNWPYEEARQLFVEPDVTDASAMEVRSGNI